MQDIYYRLKNFIKKLSSIENRIYIKNQFGIVIETVCAGCRFVTFYR